MAVFDPTLWRQRALTRSQRATKAGHPQGEIDMRLARDMIAITGLERLIEWCNKRKIDISFTRNYGGIYFHEEKRIRLNGRMQPERQLHVALHECGHHLIGLKDRNERFGMGYSQDDPSITRTFHHRCDVLDEEFDAWHRGRRLASRLGIMIEKDRYDVTRTELLRTYLKWALRMKGYAKESDEEPVA